MELKGKVAIVTGGAVRIGKALALALAQEGSHVVIHYNASTQAAQETLQEIQACGVEGLALQADLGQPAQAATLVARTTAHFGHLNILVNSAAIFEPGNWDDTTEENWDRHFAINLKSPFFLSQAFARQVGSAQAGHIVNIADWRAVRPGPSYMAYTLTKAALVAMTQSLALALAPHIQVNAIAPGMILPPPGKDRAYLERWAQKIPAQRIGSPGEIAKALRFLLQSDFVTGEMIFVTGGEHL